MIVKGLYEFDADIELRARRNDLISLKTDVANATRQNSDDIHLAVKDDFGDWIELKFERIEADMEIAYLVVQRRIESTWELVRDVNKNGCRVEKKIGTARNMVTDHCEDISKVLRILSVLERYRNSLVPVAQIINVWSCDEGGFLVQYEAKTDLRHLVIRNRAVSVSMRYNANKLVEWHKIAWQKRFCGDLSYLNEFVLDGDGNVKLMPGCIKSKIIDPDSESKWVKRCGESLAWAFSDSDDQSEVSSRICRGDVESVLAGIKEDVAGIIRSCVGSEEDRATFSSLLHSLSLNCAVTLSNCLDDADVITDTVAYSWRGLRRGSVVEIIKKEHDTAPDDIFILKSDRIVGDIITVDYQPEMTLSYIIIEREVDILKRLKHERIVQCLGYFHQRRESILVKMELMETSLGAIVRERGSGLQVGEVRHYTLHIAEGLAYLHSRSIIHRDLKCDNVLVKGGNAKLTNFGLSLVLTRGQKNIPRHSQKGTPYTMAPEVIAEEPYDCRLDIWSLGVAVWEMSSGRYCFEGLSAAQIILKIYKTKALEHNPNIPREIQTFINLCAKSNPHERPTAAQLLTDPFLQAPVITIKLSNLLDPSDSFLDRFSWQLEGMSIQTLIESIERRLKVCGRKIFVLKDKSICKDEERVKSANNAQFQFVVLESFDQFQLGDFLGEGGFGSVWGVSDQSGQNRWAVKKFHGNATQSKILSTLLTEVAVMRSLRHERIMSFQGLFHENGSTICIRMDLMEGSLCSYYKTFGGLPLEKVKFFSRQILEGLVYLHDNAILHRDLKCENVLMKEGQVKLADFGLAKTITLSKMDRRVNTSFAGTVNFMAPEVVNEEKYDSKIDIWSFGATIWEMASGRVPFTGMGYAKVVIEIYKKRALEDNPALHGDIKAILHECNQPDPSARPTASELQTRDFFRL